MTESQDSGQGCLGCFIFIVFFLGFAHPGWWVLAFILLVIAGLSKSPSSSADRSSSSSNTSTSTSTISPDDIDNLLRDIIDDIDNLLRGDDIDDIDNFLLLREVLLRELDIDIGQIDNLLLLREVLLRELDIDIGQGEIKDPVTQETFISPSVPDDIDNLLIDIGQGEIKDPVTQETFRPGEMVHLCLVHRLAYHEDSWREMGCQCMVCGNNAHTRVYTLPAPFNINLSNQNTQAHIDWRDIESSADRSSSSSNTSTSTSAISPSVPDDIDNLLDDDIDLLETTLEKVQKIVAEQLGVDAGEVKPEASFTEDLGADPLDTVELPRRRVWD